jgi:hypothetical protein
MGEAAREPNTLHLATANRLHLMPREPAGSEIAKTRESH